MKYMGSKRAMLLNGLGELLAREVPKASRFVDLFTGSGTVAKHVAQSYQIPVLASDLQEYSVALAGSVICRDRPLEAQRIWERWLISASEYLDEKKAKPIELSGMTAATVSVVRAWSAQRQDLPITAAYGGHYFSATQAIWIDALRATLPRGLERRQLALAALIQAASQCAASPGHTAQPFQPTLTARKFLFESWRKDVLNYTKRNLITLAGVAAKTKGFALKADANILAEDLSVGDLVFIDPPYSGVHYSRFYHVLESIASGQPGAVSGVGRYPEERKRPRSRYSIQTQSGNAIRQLLETTASRGARVIITFPDHQCSNGLSGQRVQSIASQFFRTKRKVVSSRFSTLGGTSGKRDDQAGRDARLNASELVLLLTTR
jgi:adenine-specific DNA-methyltransferase